MEVDCSGIRKEGSLEGCSLDFWSVLIHSSLPTQLISIMCAAKSRILGGLGTEYQDILKKVAAS